MKYAGMPFGMWTLFAPSFRNQLTAVFGYGTNTAKAITKKAKPKYREIISELPEFEKGDRFKMNIVNCAMLGAFILSMPEHPDVERLTEYYAKSMMTKPMKWFCRKSGKNKFTPKDISGMKATATLKAADRNPYSWNMEFYEYPDGSGYEGRFTKCGICVLMKKLGLYDLIPAVPNSTPAANKPSSFIMIVLLYKIYMSNRWPRWQHRNDPTVSSSRNGKSLSSRRLRC